MNGIIWSQTPDARSDEHPDTHEAADEVIERQPEFVKIRHCLTPILNCKGAWLWPTGAHVFGLVSSPQVPCRPALCRFGKRIGSHIERNRCASDTTYGVAQHRSCPRHGQVLGAILPKPPWREHDRERDTTPELELRSCEMLLRAKCGGSMVGPLMKARLST